MRRLLKLIKIFYLAGVSALVLLVGYSIADSIASKTNASGTLVNGFRILTVEGSQHLTSFTVYRGDYIKFQIDPKLKDPVLQIPALSINQRLSPDSKDSPYFKMKKSGTYDFSLGSVTGQIHVINYYRENYREVTSQEAAVFIKSSQPLILDVRMPSEYKAGRIEGARLIPVQELHRRLHELKDNREEPILVYCATGNRSTVASKMLNDNGFKDIVNMRYGIYQWAKDGLAVVR
jgi:rhodanese-related sulfurtransferase